MATRRARIGRILGLALLAAVSTSPGIGAQEASPVPGRAGIDGDWSLNRALSDDPSERIVQPAVPPPVPGAPPSQSGSGRSAPPSSSSAPAVLRRAIGGFSIESSDSTVAISYPDRNLVLFTDGREQKVLLPGEIEAEYRAWWEGAQLVVERRLDGGLVLTESYSEQAETGRLHILTRLEGDRLPRSVSFVRVYDPAPAGRVPADSGPAPEGDQPGLSASAG